MLNSKVSVVIPVYNSEKFLKESIESVIHQTYSDIEIIVINDGSTDGSLEILKQYEDKITIINQENMGLAEAVNAGIKKMSGNWLKWLSPDDVLYPNTVELLVEETKKLPENTILYSNWEMIDEKGKKLRDFHESNYNDLDNFEFNIRLLDGQQINVNTCLIPSLLFRNGCTVHSLPDITTIDYEFFLRAALIYKINFFHVNKIILGYRIHSKQLSHKNILKSLYNLKTVKEKVLSQIESSEKENYISSLIEYQKNKPLKKKTLELGLKISQTIFPNWLTNKLLLFYLNKMRTSR